MEDLAETIKSMMETIDLQNQLILTLSQQVRTFAQGMNIITNNIITAIEKDEKAIQKVFDQIGKEINNNRCYINQDRERFIKHQIDTTRDN